MNRQCDAPIPEELSLAEIRRHLKGGELGAQIELHDVLDSTNTRAAALAAEGAPHGAAVLAREQTAGRGRFERRFYSPQGSGLYVSFILRPQLPASQAVRLTTMAGVAVARTIERTTDLRAQIKWVNDVYIGARKVSGILCESALDFERGCLRHCVLGIGVNLGRMDFPPELCEVATSVENENGTPVSRSLFCAELINALNALYPELESASFMEEYRARSNVLGKRVLVLRGDERFCARAESIDDDACLRVCTDDGQQIVLHSGEISLRFT